MEDLLNASGREERNRSCQSTQHEEEKKAQQVLLNDVVVEHICQYLSNQDLLDLSLINKTWLKQGRRILRHQRHCYLHIDREHGDLLERLRQLKLSSVHSLPYNGLKVSHWSPKLLQPEIVTEIRLIFERCQLKYLHLDYGYFDQAYSDACEISWMQLIENGAKSIQEIRLGRFASNILKRFGGLKDVAMPSLRVISPFGLKTYEIHDELSEDEDMVDGLKTLIRNAPRLTEIEWSVKNFIVTLPPEVRKFVKVCRIDVDILSVSPREASSSLRSVKCDGSVRLPYPHHIPEDALLDQGWFVSQYETNLFTENLKLVLSSSLNSLKEIELNYCVLEHLVQSQQAPLINLEDLVLHIHGDVLEANPAPACVKLFPKLRRVKILSDRLECYRGSHLKCSCASKITKLEGPCKLSSVKEIVISELPLLPEAFSQFAQSCPNVIKLTWSIKLSGCRSFAKFLPLIWEAMVKLECIKFGFHGWFAIVNLDAVICGITTEEANYLFTYREALRSCSIMPIRPAMSDLTNLKRLEFIIQEDAPSWRLNIADSWFLSRVTNHLVFQRMPQLQVFLNYGVDEGKGFPDLKVLDHMRPFMKVTPLNGPHTMPESSW